MERTVKCNAYMAASWGNQWALGGRHKLRHAQHDTASSSSWLAPNIWEEEDPPCPVCFFSKSHSSSPEWLNTDWMGNRGGSWSKFSIKLVSYCLWIRSPTGAEPPPSAFGDDLNSIFLGVVAVLIYVLFEQIGGATFHLHFPFCGSKLLQVSNLSDNVSEGSESASLVWLIGEQGRKVSCFPWVSWKAN